MQAESRKYLYDISRAAELLRRFTAGKSFADFSADELLQSAVERQFEVIGEAVNRLAQVDPETAAQISEYRRVISLRNILIHSYAQVDLRILWDVLQVNLPILERETRLLLDGS